MKNITINTDGVSVSIPTRRVTRFTFQENGITVSLDFDKTELRELFLKVARSMSRAELAAAIAQLFAERVAEFVGESEDGEDGEEEDE